VIRGATKGRLRSRAEEMRCWATRQLGQITGTGPALPEPAASPLHDALNAVAAHAAAARGFSRADLWPLLDTHLPRENQAPIRRTEQSRPNPLASAKGVCR
jgi:hypothetical protein